MGSHRHRTYGGGKGHLSRHFSLREATERAARLLPERAMIPPNEATESGDLQAVYEDGSDGTRTRDLRRDRPVQAQPVRSAPTLNYGAGAGISCQLELAVTGYGWLPTGRACVVRV